MDEPGLQGRLPHVATREQARLLGPVLKGTSRAFYLTLRVLPADLRKPVGLAYLLARTADTIADSKGAPADVRLQSLLQFRALVEGPRDPRRVYSLVAELIARAPSSSWTQDERELVDAIPHTLAILEGLERQDGERVSRVVATLNHGMEMDLTHFNSDGLIAFQTPAQLDEYTYLVAGCVGEFWTEISAAHNPGLGARMPGEMGEWGVGFGKALQMTNVLRDVPRDLRAGRCYLPTEILAPCGLSPSDLLDPESSSRARPALAWGIERALAHYVEAERYLLAIPRRHVRLRLAAAWPLLMGLATLAELARHENWLDPTLRSRVSRGWVYRMMAASGPRVMSNAMMRRWIRGLRREVERAL